MLVELDSELDGCLQGVEKKFGCEMSRCYDMEILALEIEKKTSQRQEDSVMALGSVELHHNAITHNAITHKHIPQDKEISTLVLQ